MFKIEVKSSLTEHIVHDLGKVTVVQNGVTTVVPKAEFTDKIGLKLKLLPSLTVSFDEAAVEKLIQGFEDLKTKAKEEAKEETKLKRRHNLK